MSGNGEIARDVLAERWEALEGPPLLLVERPAEDGGLDLLIYDEHGALVDSSFVPAELVDRDEVAVAVSVPRQRQP
ncbi:hypothetical protein ABTY98_41595 [Streptomyces sp. NPDC096040]|uniref:hypothetical protein n=1 Tax=Streptomyces sp. NPDC096040 TaxID=3155541 RepID=UPI00331EBF16